MIVLDIGCGTGLLSLELLKQYRNILVIGIDYSPKMLLQFRKAVLKRGIESNIRIIQANAECLPLKSSSLDAVLSIYGLGGIPHLDSTMSEIKRVISKNGIVCFGEMVSPPDSSNVISRKIHQKIVEPLIKFFWEFRDIKLPELLLKYGFEIKEKKYYKNRILGSTLIIKAKP
jgi:ubiquinone/menaquinone biosynthesis C-methylase UbiE